MTQSLTSKENIVINLLFEWLGEERYNRTTADYMAIALRVPKTAAVHAYVNQRLGEIAKSGVPPYEICYFKAGDYGHWYAPFPDSLSMETVRMALKNFGIPELRVWAKSAA